MLFADFQTYITATSETVRLPVFMVIDPLNVVGCPVLAVKEASYPPSRKISLSTVKMSVITLSMSIIVVPLAAAL